MSIRLPQAGTIRLSSIALTAALLFALGGLFAVDRALARQERIEAEVQAVEMSATIDGFLDVHAAALQSLRLLHVSAPHGAAPEDLRSVMMPMMEHARGFRRVWVTDSATRVLDEYVVGPAAESLPDGLRLDTVVHAGLGELARRARATRRTQVTGRAVLYTDERGIIILEPLFSGETFLGIAGASIASERFLESVLRRPDGRVHDVLVLAGSDTIAERQWTGRRAFAGVAASQLVVPGPQIWTVMVRRTLAGPWLRFAVWSVGLATLGALLVALLHERRHARRMLERSSELERLSSELLRANRAKSEFLANVSHELRTPLNAIVGFVDLLRDGVYGELPPRQSAPVERIASSATHLRVLVDQVLDIARMAAGRLEVEREPVELRPFLMDVVTEVEALMDERGLQRAMGVSPTLPRVNTDRTHLRQIMINLLGNAVKFTSHGVIAVRAREVAAENDLPPRVRELSSDRPSPVSPWVAIEVSDTGVGIDPSDHERVFEEFEQVNAGPRSDSMERGTGLGLPISRRLARLLGGDITLESALGRGSTFTLWLPVSGTGAMWRTLGGRGVAKATGATAGARGG